jgi:hypothetical protein
MPQNDIKVSKMYLFLRKVYFRCEDMTVALVAYKFCMKKYKYM